MAIEYAQTPWGFRWGQGLFQRCAHDERRGWVCLSVDAKRHSGNRTVQVYVTKGGRVRVFDHRGEWKAPGAKR